MSKKLNPGKDTVQRELRDQQKFSISGAIGRAGSGLMKGESPITQQEQSIAMLAQWIDQHTPDPSGALKSVLRDRVRDNELLVARNLKEPYRVLQKIIDSILSSNYSLQEFVRQVDVRWGQMYNERPLFQSEGVKPHPDDEYTYESVRQDLMLLLEKLQQSNSLNPAK
ncbi:MAG: hypothetical protein R6V21_05130 [Pelovirga sp.]